MKLAGQTAIITGANQGFGFAVAKEFLLQGANIAICARNNELLEQAKKGLMTIAKTDTRIYAQTLDIANYNEAEKFVSVVHEKFKRVDILVANAGIYGPKGAIDKIDWQEWCDAIDINLKATVFMCRAVLPILKKQRAGKIILLSGGGATKPMPYLSAYAASKAAVVRFAETLADEVKEFNIDVNSIAPGALNTRLLEEVLAAGPETVGEQFYAQSVKQKQTGGASLEIGAGLCTFLASSESDGISGKLISAVWDPWKNINNFKDELQKSDIYTLRRIVPTDRGQNWEIK